MRKPLLSKPSSAQLHSNQLFVLLSSSGNAINATAHGVTIRNLHLHGLTHCTVQQILQMLQICYRSGKSSTLTACCSLTVQYTTVCGLLATVSYLQLPAAEQPVAAYFPHCHGRTPLQAASCTGSALFVRAPDKCDLVSCIEAWPLVFCPCPECMCGIQQVKRAMPKGGLPVGTPVWLAGGAVVTVLPGEALVRGVTWELLS